MATLFRINNVNSNLALDVALHPGPNQGHIQQYTPNSGNNQQWALRRYGVICFHQIVNQNSGKAVEISSDSNWLSQVDPQPMTPAFNDVPAVLARQLWKITKPDLSNAAGFQISNLATGKVFDVPLDNEPDHGKASGIRIQQYKPNSGFNQQWTFKPATNSLLSVIATPGVSNEVSITGTGFTDYKEKYINIYLYGVPGTDPNGLIPASNLPITVNSDGAFFTNYTNEFPNVSQNQKVGSRWATVIVEDENKNLLAVSSIPVYGSFFIPAG